jgi:hypothetical protein
LSFCDSCWCIELEQVCGGSPFWGLAYDLGVLHSEMFVPDLGAWIEEKAVFIGLRVKGAEVATFVAIAAPTGKGEVIGDGFAPMFQGNDVIDFVGIEAKAGG